MNGYALAREHWVASHVDDGDEGYDELVEPEISDCRGVRAGLDQGLRHSGSVGNVAGW